MAKRSISKTFQDKDTHSDIFDWMLANLPLEETHPPDEIDYLTKRIRIIINFDPDNKMSLIPEGGKIPKHHAKTRG